MARPVSPTLTDAELRLMKVLWRRGASTAASVARELATRGVELSESSVRTVLGILADKQYVAIDRRGRSIRFRATVGAQEARERAIRHILDRFFDGSREELALTLIRDQATSSGERARIRRIVLEDR